MALADAAEHRMIDHHMTGGFRILWNRKSHQRRASIVWVVWRGGETCLMPMLEENGSLYEVQLFRSPARQIYSLTRSLPGFLT